MVAMFFCQPLVSQRNDQKLKNRGAHQRCFCLAADCPGYVPPSVILKVVDAFNADVSFGASRTLQCDPDIAAPVGGELSDKTKNT